FLAGFAFLSRSAATAAAPATGTLYLDNVGLGTYVDIVRNHLLVPFTARVHGPTGPLAHANVLFTVPQGAAKYLLNRRGDVDDQVTLRTDAEGYAQAWVLVPVDFAATNILAVAAGTPGNFTRVRMRVLVDDYSGTGTLQWNTNGIPQPWAVATRTKLLDPVGPPAGVMAFSVVAGFGEGDIFLSTNLFLEPHGYSNDLVYLRLHNTHSGSLYQLISKVDITSPTWEFGEIITGNGGNVDFTPVPAEEDDTRFFGINTNAWLAIDFAPGSSNFAREPYSVSNDPGQTVTLRVTRTGITNAAITASFNLTGSAGYTNDYSLKTNGTALTNFTFTLAAGATNFDFVIQPVDDHTSAPEFEESVVAVLNSNASFAMVPDRRYLQVFIEDNPPMNLFQPVFEFHGTAGIDYQPVSNALIVSITGDVERNFLFVTTNGAGQLIVTNYSEITQLTDEVKLAVVQTTANGFTAGEMFFGTGGNGVIGKVAADGTNYNANWATLPPPPDGVTNLFRGGLYVDQTGVFSNDLIVVTGGDQFQGGDVWRIDSSANAVLLASLTNRVRPHLEGVITLSNDVARWGPWAGKIITGAESELPPRIYTIATNGAVLTNYLGISPEDFDLIPPNQDLYTFRMEKIPREFFTSNYWGDLLITQAGEISGYLPSLFITHWDSTNQLFFTTRIANDTSFEHVSFAPIQLPASPPP
ncbi:MAG: hypothetical protein HY301_11890, partial [Verrucomicrobia bacterium]|nr:hypothetical protein [Verrucomicrobiota bacterium]